MYYQAKQILKKARQQKHGSHPTILSRWYASESYRNSLLCHRVERKTHSVVRQNRLGEEHQRPPQKLKEFKIRSIGFSRLIQKDISHHSIKKRECKRLHDEHLARTQEEYRAILRSQQVRQRKRTTIRGQRRVWIHAVDPKTGWRFYRGSRRSLQTASLSSSTWDQTHCQHSSSSDDWGYFSQS